MEYYVITDEANYVTSGGLTEDIELASLWEKECSATNYLNTIKNAKGTNKTYGRNIPFLKVKKIERGVCLNKNLMIDSIEESSDLEYIECDNTPICPPLDDLFDILDNLPNKLKNETSRLSNQLKTISMAITDVYHYLELTPKISASDRCKLSTLESELLRQRRKTKDDISKVEKLEKMIRNNGFNKPNIGLDDRIYTPRVLSELFETKKIPTFDEWWNKED